MWTPIRRRFRAVRPLAPDPAPPRRLFLDDDPARAEAFLATHPDAVWVQTADECLGRLAEPWDEVHLDHDLGGEVYVELDRDDCGMAVVRWLCREARPQLAATRFVVHSWNEGAACAMALELLTSGYLVEVRPFGRAPEADPGPGPGEGEPRAAGRLVGWLGRLAARAGLRVRR